jgi:hypothetical protein
MKPAEIFCVTGDGFSWKWRAADGERESKDTFTYFYDCYEDALRRGYSAKFVKAPGRSGQVAPSRPPRH